jgi:hypothetical protein
LLAASDHSFGAHSMFSQHAASAEMQSSAAPFHGGIHTATLDENEAAAMLDLPWFPFPVSLRTLSLVIDCLILLCAVLIFEVVSLAMTNLFPVGWAGAGLLLLTVVSFCGVYWYLFEKVAGATPGKVLVDCASAEQDGTAQRRDEDRPRFR